MKMKSNQSRGQQGFTLIASLLMMVLLSGLAVGLMYMTNTASHIGGNDMEANLAFYAAESGMEKMTADLGALYATTLSPTPAQLTAIASIPPSPSEIPNVAYQEAITWPGAPGNPITTTAVISSGANQGLTAEIIPLTLTSTATRVSGANASLNRNIEVALIPVFQFGVFSDSDLSYFAGPVFDFQGRIHTNGNLYLAANSGPLIADGKVTAFGQVIRDRLADNYSNGGSYQGDVYVPNVTGGCDTYNGSGSPPSSCGLLTMGDGSWAGGIPPNSGGAVGTWLNTSTVTFNGFIGNAGSTGVEQLTLPFAAPGVSQAQVIRKPVAGEVSTSTIGTSREYNKANIRILFANTQADLHPERGPLGDGQDVDLTNGGAGGLNYNVSGVGTTYLAWGSTTQGDGAWVKPYGTTANTWPLVDGWLRVEYLNTAGVWVGITTEWLQLGFARGLAIPSTPLTGNNVHPKAILILQEQADRNADGVITTTSYPPTGDEPANITGAASQWSFYPINFYDPREGFPHDATPTGFTATQCYANGVMGTAELDVGNLNAWLLGTIPGSGTLVNYAPQNGYLVYFSDRRGMVADPNVSPVATSGESGIEDVINSSSATEMPDGVLEPINSGYNDNDMLSPEDVDGNGKLDNWGMANIGYGFGINTNTVPPNPFVTINCAGTGVVNGRANKVTGARHVLRLVDGGLGNLPVRPDTGGGGFTVASENPLYIWGNYNTNASDPFWSNPQETTDIAHSNASIIADAVSLQSAAWSDLTSMLNPHNLAGRVPTSTYYRTAIAGGKNRNFPNPASATGADFGTDGGVHNFLRYMESWSGINLYYRGSLVSLYYAQYNTGVYKCCTLVYGAPGRKYYFDNEFLNPANLPPGTPELQDIDNLSYWQNLQAY